MNSASSLLLLLSLLALRAGGVGAEGGIEEKTSTASTSCAASKKKILSFGGNGMIGSETLHRLIKTDEYDITLVSRGSWPFDAGERIAPHVKSVICDRKAGIDTCNDLLDEIQSTDEYYAVLDFSAYNPNWIKDAVEALVGRVRLYVYVSTDSVYEVTEMESYMKTGRRSAENDAVRPVDGAMRERLNHRDSYGHRKLQGEEVLAEQRGSNQNEGVAYVSLRFADIIGPRDNTDRFLTYYAWIKFHDLESVPSIAVPHNVVEGTSITYVGDAASSIIAAIDESNVGGWDEAYNIGCEDIFNVTSQIMTIGHLLGKHSLRPKKDDIDLYIYPSVTKGPIDIAKARDRIGFVPTPLDVVLFKTVAWYENMYLEHRRFRDDVLSELINILDEAYDYESDEERDDTIEALKAEVARYDEALHIRFA
mmetsp:Transcript_533/g.1254  ORF Transcript_533/g.1254 Transcript_533/m.1254 type:complete len:422 (+) Transcript_533:109-1374(+)